MTQTKAELKESMAEFVLEEIWAAAQRNAGKATIWKAVGDPLFFILTEILKKGASLEQLNKARLMLEEVKRVD